MTAVLDEWGEEIKGIPDDGVFSESSLGEYDTQPGHPNTMKGQFPYAPMPQKVIHQVDANRYGLYAPGMGADVHSAYPGGRIKAAMIAKMNGMSGCGCSRAPGMGDLYDDIIGTQDEIIAGNASQTTTPDAGFNWDTMSTGQRTDLITGVVGQATDLAMGLASGITSIQRAGERHDLQMIAARQQLEQQGELFAARLEQLRQAPAANADAIAQIQRLQAQLTQAAANANSSGSAADLARLQALLTESRNVVGPSPWPWIVGGIGVVGVLGLVAYLVMRKD